MRIGACEACSAKDAIIDDLRVQLADTHKTLLAMADARAYALRFPAERPAAPAGPPPPPSRTPARVRAETFVPEMTPRSVEAAFEQQEALERRVQGS